MPARVVDPYDFDQRLRRLERQTTEDRATMNSHILACIAANTAAANFRKELRGYFVMILCAIIGILAAFKFHLVGT